MASEKRRVRCECGQLIAYKSENEGRVLKCPKCQASVMLSVAPVKSANTLDARQDRSGRKPLIIGVIVGLVGLAASASVLWMQEKSLAKRHVQEADAALAEAIKDSLEWLADPDPETGEQVETGLLQTLESNLITSADKGNATLESVRNRRAELSATTVLNNAKTQLESGDLAGAAAAIQGCRLALPESDVPVADQLLAEIQLITSDDHLKSVLANLDDDALADVRTSAVEGISTPALLARAREKLEMMLPEEHTRRKNIRLQAERLAKQKEELAKLQAQMEEEKRQEAEEKARQAAEKARTEAIKKAVTDYLMADRPDRYQYVIPEEGVEEAIVAYARTQQSLRITEVNGQVLKELSGGYILSSASVASGNQQAVLTMYVREIDGRFLVDWKASVGFNDPSFTTFQAAPPKTPVVFRVKAKLNDYFTSDAEDFGVTESNGIAMVFRDNQQEQLWGYALKDSDVGKAMFDALKDGQMHDLTVEVIAIDSSSVAVTRLLRRDFLPLTK